MVEVEIGGKKRKFSFGLEVLGWVQIESGIDLANPKHSASEMSLFYVLICPVILLGNKRELQKEGKDVDYTYEDVDKWIQEKGMTDEGVMKIWNAFNATLVNYLPKQEDEKAEKPKKK
jgi:hypothetical protein